MDQFITMLAGAAFAGPAAWLTTTGLLAILICLLGAMAGQDWWTPVGKTWWKVAVLLPLWLLGQILRIVAMVFTEVVTTFTANVSPIHAKKKKKKGGSHDDDHD